MTTAFDLVGTVLNRHNDPFKALLKLRESVPIGEVWRELLSRPDYLATIAENSYRHDNGFDKIVLVGSPTSQLKLVLHVWRAGSDRHKDNIHNHREKTYTRMELLATAWGVCLHLNFVLCFCSQRYFLRLPLLCHQMASFPIDQ